MLFRIAKSDCCRNALLQFSLCLSECQHQSTWFWLLSKHGESNVWSPWADVHCETSAFHVGSTRDFLSSSDILRCIRENKAWSKKWDAVRRRNHSAVQAWSISCSWAHSSRGGSSTRSMSRATRTLLPWRQSISHFSPWIFEGVTIALRSYG